MRCGVKLPGDDIAASDELGERVIDRRACQIPPRDDVRGYERDVGSCPAAEQRGKRLATRIEVRVRQPDREGHPERLAIPTRIVGRYPSRLAGDANRPRPPPAFQSPEPL